MGTVKRTNPAFADNLLDRMKEVASKEVACGYPRGINDPGYPDGESVIDVAVKNCFGIGVPVRDFMTLGKQLIDGDHIIKECMAQIAKAAAENQPAIIAAQQKAAGERAADLIKEAIQTGDWTPNSEETKRRKGSEQPLIDSRNMLNSATYVVREKTT